MITIEIVDSSRRRKEENKMSKKKIIKRVIVNWRKPCQYMTTTYYSDDSVGYSVDKEGKIFMIPAQIGLVVIPTERVQSIEVTDVLDENV